MSFVLLFKTILYGIVEGITEWLPISSTGHLVLLGGVLDLGMSDSFMEMFNVVIQLGAILAVVVLYFKRLWPFHTAAAQPERNWFANPTDEGAAGAFQRFANRYLYMDKLMLWLKIIVSVLPAIVIGWPLDNLVEQYMYKAVPIALMLILYGVLFLLIERRNRNRRSRVTRLSRITWKDALIVGLFQVLAIIPGTSRSGATIIGGILIGLARPIAAEYTFFLAIPTMLGASVLKVAKFGGHFTTVEGGVLAVGMIVAFLVSMVAIRFLMQYIRKHDFKVFGWYRIALGILVLILTAAGVLSNTLT